MSRHANKRIGGRREVGDVKSSIQLSETCAILNLDKAKINYNPNFPNKICPFSGTQKNIIWWGQQKKAIKFKTYWIF